jgi:hypothetical protein
MPDHLLFTDLLIHALLRATFGLGLCWRAPDRPFTVCRDSGNECIRDTFRFDDAGEWLEFQGIASARNAEVPQVRVRMTVPVAAMNADAALRIANDINRKGYAPVYYDAESKALVVQDVVVFTGFHDTPTVDFDPAFTLAQNEVTLNTLVAAFNAAYACVQAVWPERVRSEQTLMRVEASPPDLLDAFSVFVLSRMYRWGLIRLENDGAALRLLRDAAARCLLADEAAVLEPGAEHARSEEAARARVEGWMRSRMWRERCDDAYLDAILFDVDRAARTQLRELMSDPPTARPLHQMRLLEDALARRLENWQGVQVTEGNPRAALAVGLDVEIDRVSPSFVQRLCERHPFLAPVAGAASVVLPQEHWLTTNATKAQAA